MEANGVNGCHRLLCDETERLSDVESIKAHPFFRGVDWSNIRKKKAAIIPVLSGPLDTSYFDSFEVCNVSGLFELLETPNNIETGKSR